ncbi:hypothetical protein [Massilia timonae]|uniref:hypothetical protein n=1 Tax=Massilia timonae TaxID=47229 RepID=UPI0028D16499|nr:hypothetical protein [Massilia timonae]
MTISYEMQGISQFLVQLGYFLGKQQIAGSGFLNTFQQTSLDAALGDFFGSTNFGDSEEVNGIIEAKDRFFMIEFKREGVVSSESLKDGVRAHVRQRLEDKHSLNYREGDEAKIEKWAYRDLSYKAHIFGEFYDNQGQPDCSFYPYLEDVLPNILMAHSNNAVRQSTIESFIENAMFSVVRQLRIGVNKEEFQDYLQFLFEGWIQKTSSTEDTMLYVFRTDGIKLTWSCTTQLSKLFSLSIPGKRLPVKNSANKKTI